MAYSKQKAIMNIKIDFYQFQIEDILFCPYNYDIFLPGLIYMTK